MSGSVGEARCANLYFLRFDLLTTRTLLLCLCIIGDRLGRLGLLDLLCLFSEKAQALEHNLVGCVLGPVLFVYLAN